jgi:DNA replication ATP-dependent helicase Dna2
MYVLQGNELLDQLLTVHQSTTLSFLHKYFKVKKLADVLLAQLTADETELFTDTYTRISYIAVKYELTNKQKYLLNRLRYSTQKVLKIENIDVAIHQYQAAFVAETKNLAQIIAKTYHLPLPTYFKNLSDAHTTPTSMKGKYIPQMRVEVVEINHAQKTIICSSEEKDTLIKVFYDVEHNQSGRYINNKAFSSSLQKIEKGTVLNLVDVWQDETENYYPNYFIVMPDILVDVSAIAECRQQANCLSALYFRSKYTSDSTTTAILLGNIANFFLDEQISHTDTDTPPDFKQIFVETFKLYPFQYTTLAELESKENFMKFYYDALRHFTNIGRMLDQDFKQKNINSARCYIEPSFFSEKYGIQGRLDLLHIQEKGIFDIFELKSSAKVPDGTKLWANHTAQISLYAYLLNAVFEVPFNKINPHIIYSAAEKESIRYTSVVSEEVKILLNLRNDLVMSDINMAKATDCQQIQRLFFQSLRLPEDVNIAPFYWQSIAHIKQTLQQATLLEQKYFFSFIAFIAREILLAKIGETEQQTGFASLWRNTVEEKREAYQILAGLQLQSIAEDERTFFLTRTDSDVVNFREGEAVVFYAAHANKTALNSQIFKAAIVKITQGNVEIRLRYKQHHLEEFNQNSVWNIEHDLIESSYQLMNRQLLDFLRPEIAAKRNLILGLTPPSLPENQSFAALPPNEDDLSEEEQRSNTLPENSTAKVIELVKTYPMRRIFCCLHTLIAPLMKYVMQ